MTPTNLPLRKVVNLNDGGLMVIEEGYRWTRPGELRRARCYVCGEPCEIRRNVLGPTCFAQAIGKHATLHDAIVCPHSGRRWHNRVYELRCAIEDSPSKRLAAIMREDLRDALAEHLPARRRARSAAAK
jgi:hypothetical protein